MGRRKGKRGSVKAAPDMSKQKQNRTSREEPETIEEEPEEKANPRRVEPDQEEDED
jgi:hypothetical protein